MGVVLPSQQLLAAKPMHVFTMMRLHTVLLLFC